MEIAAAAASPRASWRSRSNGAPFARCSLGSVRLLVGFTLLAEEAVAARSFLLRTAGLDCTLPCAVLLPMTAAVRNAPAFGGRFDASLAMLLGSCVGAFEHRSARPSPSTGRSERRACAAESGRERFLDSRRSSSRSRSDTSSPVPRSPRIELRFDFDPSALSRLYVSPILDRRDTEVSEEGEP